MTLEQLLSSEMVFLSPADISPILKCDPQSIRKQAQKDPSKLGFNIIVIGSRILIPRIEFLHFLGL